MVPTRTLPPSVVLSLREAFASEVVERLPALRQGSADDARRAAHSLGSSAYVVGEPDLALLARDVEARLETGRPWQQQGAQLIAALERWAV